MVRAPQSGPAASVWWLWPLASPPLLTWEAEKAEAPFRRLRWQHIRGSGVAQCVWLPRHTSQPQRLYSACLHNTQPAEWSLLWNRTSDNKQSVWTSHCQTGERVEQKTLTSAAPGAWTSWGMLQIGVPCFSCGGGQLGSSTLSFCLLVALGTDTFVSVWVPPHIGISLQMKTDSNKNAYL